MDGRTGIPWTTVLCQVGAWADEFEDQESYDKERVANKPLQATWMTGRELYIESCNQGEKKFRYRNEAQRKKCGLSAADKLLELRMSRPKKILSDDYSDLQYQVRMQAITVAAWKSNPNTRICPCHRLISISSMVNGKMASS